MNEEPDPITSKIDFEEVKKYNKYLSKFNTKVNKKYLEMLFIKRYYYESVIFKPHFREQTQMEIKRFIKDNEVTEAEIKLIEDNLESTIERKILNNDFNKKKYITSKMIKKRNYLEDRLKKNEKKIKELIEKSDKNNVAL